MVLIVFVQFWLQLKAFAFAITSALYLSYDLHNKGLAGRKRHFPLRLDEQTFRPW